MYRLLREQRRLRPLFMRPHVPLLRMRLHTLPRKDARRTRIVSHLPCSDPWRHPRLPLLNCCFFFFPFFSSQLNSIIKTISFSLHPSRISSSFFLFFQIYVFVCENLQNSFNRRRKTKKNKTINFAPSKSLYSTVNVSKIKIFFHYAVVSEKRITTCHLFSFVFYLATSFLCHFLNHFFCFFCFFSQLFFGYCEKIIATKYRKRWLS